MSLPSDIATYYSRPGRMTDAAALDAFFKDAPSDIPGMVAYIQNLLLHQHWAQAYRVNLSDARKDESNNRTLTDMLSTVQERDGRPLAFVRTLAQRTVCVCRHFSTFGVALFRRAGIPARARCGFGAYFQKDFNADHWVVEYWNGASWQLLDAQIDAVQRAALQLAFDPLDVPRDQFIIAGEAWSACRAGKSDPEKFGIFGMKGLWFIAGNLIRDFAALNNMEMLPWDSWGAMTGPDVPIPPQSLDLFDHLAELTHEPDRHFAEIRETFTSDARLCVPAEVFNILRRRPEKV